MRRVSFTALFAAAACVAAAACGDNHSGEAVDLPESAFSERFVLMAGMINNVPELSPGGYAPKLGPIEVELIRDGGQVGLAYAGPLGYVSAESLASLRFDIVDGGSPVSIDPWLTRDATDFVRDVLALEPELTVTGRPTLIAAQTTDGVIVIDTLWPVRVPDQPAEQADLLVAFRISLIARSAVPVDAGAIPNAGTAASARFGFNAIPADDPTAAPLEHMPMGPRFADEPITIYLKYFPDEYVRAAEQAIEAWNQALGAEVFAPAPATAAIDVLDPRYFVLKWIDPGDDPSFSGLYYSQNDPVTGVSLGGAMYFHGGVVSYRQSEHAYTNDVLGYLSPGAPEIDSGLMSDPDIAVDDLVFDFVQSVLVHEIGHQLGLDHNFEGSWTADGTFWSSMDYAPRNLRHRRLSPGAYDAAAALWAYYDSGVSNDLPMCRNFEVNLSPTCSHSDIGDPIDYVLDNLPVSLDLVERVPVAATEYLLSPIKTMLNNAQKLICLADQLPPTRRDAVVTAAQALLDRAPLLVPDAGLSAAAAEIVAGNLAVVVRDANEVVELGCAPFGGARLRRPPVGCMLPR